MYPLFFVVWSCNVSTLLITTKRPIRAMRMPITTNDPALRSKSIRPCGGRPFMRCRRDGIKAAQLCALRPAQMANPVAILRDVTSSHRVRAPITPLGPKNKLKCSTIIIYLNKIFIGVVFFFKKKKVLRVFTLNNVN